MYTSIPLLCNGLSGKGGALPTAKAVIAHGMTIILVFVGQGIEGTTHEITKYSLDKQTKHILNLTPS